MRKEILEKIIKDDKIILDTLSSYYRELPLDIADRQYILEYIRQTLFFPTATTTSNEILKKLSGIVCVTIVTSNKTICRIGAKSTLWHSLNTAIEYICKDAGYVNQNSISINCAILFSPKDYKPIDKADELHVGLESIQFIYQQHSAIYKSSVALKQSLSPKQALKMLCRKAGYDPVVLKQQECKVITYKTLEFEQTDSRNHYRDLYRSRELILPSDVTTTRLKASLFGIKSFFDRNLLLPATRSTLNINKQTKSGESTFSFIARFIASLTSYIHIATHLKVPIDCGQIFRALNRIVGYYIVETNDYYYIKIEGISLLGINSLLLILLVNLRHHNHKEMNEKKLYNFILSFYIQDTGAFYLEHPHSLTCEIQPNAANIAPGQALLAIQLYNENKIKNVQSLLQKSGQYYAEKWAFNQPLEMTAWFSKAFSIAYLSTKEPLYAKFIHDMNSEVLKQQLPAYYAEPDCVGAFSYQGDTKSTAFFLESLVCSYRLSKDKKTNYLLSQYQICIILGIRLLLQNQLLDKNRLTDNQFTGGFTKNVTDLTVEIDTAQHASSVIIDSLRLGVI